MAGQEIDTKEGTVDQKRRFDARDFRYIADGVIEEYEKRKRDRIDLEKEWDDVDRQIAMRPDRKFKRLPNGEIDRDLNWMAEMELPLQAQALEVLTADARRLMFPPGGRFFSAHGEMSDAYLERADLATIIKGDTNDVPSEINQDNIDKLVEGFLRNIFKQFDLRGRMDRINAEAFRRGMGVGRMRLLTKNVYIHEARGVRKETQRLPVLVPQSVKHVYLDIPKPSSHSAQILGPNHISEDWIRIENLVVAASKGSNDPYAEDGGWMPRFLKDLEPDDNGNIRLLEMEGDIIVPRSTTRSMVIPRAIVTVASGGKDSGGNVTRAVIRLRYSPYPFSSYILFPYHNEDADSAYPTSPLMKGRTIQIMAVSALNRAMDSAALKNAPPVGWDKTNMEFALKGGPAIHPYAKWGVVDPALLKVFAEVGGDPAAMSALFTVAVNLYSELTGILPARLGAQTVSHTTAFAKDAELQRGATRTVDYVDSQGESPMERLCDMTYAMALRNWPGSVSFYIKEYGGFVQIDRKHLPDSAEFEWLGAGGPADAQMKKQNKLSSLQFAVQLDMMKAQMGLKPSVNIDAAQREVLHEGGWTDVEAIMQMDKSVAVPGTENQTPLGLLQLPPGANG